jgi:hypothetical protein
MSNYIEYKLEDGSTVLVEAEESRGVVKTSNKPDEPIPSKIGFKQAFATVSPSIKEIISGFDDLHIEEAEIKFGLKSIGEAGLLAFAKVSGEVNFEVTLKWKKAKTKQKPGV